MPWYKSGTVSVALNSNAVIGTGTAFIANSRVGDAFRGPDGGWYEVTNIASDTAMSISPSYQGATNAAGVYALAPMQGYVKDSADKLRALVNQFGGVLAVLGVTPTTAGVREALNISNTDGVPEGLNNKYMSASGVRSTLLTGLDVATPGSVVAADSILLAIGKLQASLTLKASKGANSDITQLSGLTTPLTVNQGGTGANSLAGQLSALGLTDAYKKSNVLGVVSQAAGVPTGALMEYGSTATGQFWKFASGLMICTHTESKSLSLTNAYGSSSYDLASWSFPAAFLAGTIPSAYLTAVLSSRITDTSGSTTSSNTAAGFFVIDRNGIAAGSYALKWLAVGRWF